MTASTTIQTIHSKLQTRFAVSVFFFCLGLCFMSWASRIPDFKATLHMNEASLANVLWALPIGQLMTMFFSGRAVTRFGSKNVLRIAIVFYAIALTNIGLVQHPWQLAMCLFMLGVCGNMSNISVNTQGINAEALYEKPIMSSFHGVWSLSGFIGATIGSQMVKFNINPYVHFCIISSLVIIMVIVFNKYLIVTPTSKIAVSFKGIKKPDRLLIKLGIISFCCMSCEGCMFDWSGVYFKEVVKVQGSLVPLGLMSFMIMMATGRFVGDYLAVKFGRKKMVQLGGILVFSGMLFAVIFPYIITATIGFLIVGFGTSSIIPLLYSTVGRAKLKTAKGIALATVSSIGFLGFLIGPPLIGYIAQLAGLQYSFIIMACLGLGVSILISKVKEIE
ncbi:MAG: MFS transporter [Ferruginibacter sp.]